MALRQDWFFRLDQLKTFITQHQRLPKSGEKYEGFSLGDWLRDQRKSYSRGTLAANRMAALNAIPSWVWHVSDEHWHRNLETLRSYVEKYAKIPGESTVYDGIKIGQWCHRQRRYYRANRLAIEKILLLEKISLWAWAV